MLKKPRQAAIGYKELAPGKRATVADKGFEPRAKPAMNPLLNAQRPRSSLGEVFLVGAGPGDPELLTLRAVRLMREADVVVFDNLVSDEILAIVPERVERIYAGKESGNHSLAQDDINRLLVGLARKGKKVLRLKGGDPFLFGRGGEEMEFLAAHGIAFEIVPGITAASGASCYAGIPLTHRDYAQSCVFVTGHRKTGGLDLEWQALSRPKQTLVIYMGLLQVGEICRLLQEHGMPASTLVAVIERATTARQQVVCGTLSTIAQDCVRHGARPPSLIIVGEVVRLHRQLRWFDATDSAHCASSETIIV